ncbi:hypothetical protein FB451DRAFT_1401164 [Mycena latifolia]|nr:hypothetical protein FB451DRAFT_1401164 [Mycena latifolia]
MGTWRGLVQADQTLPKRKHIGDQSSLEPKPEGLAFANGQTVCNEYHTKIDWRLLDHQEPELPLREYDPLSPHPQERLEEDNRKTRHARLEELNKRIRRWLKYRVRSLHHKLSLKANSEGNRFTALLTKLSGISTPPKARQAYQQYMHEMYATTITPVVEERWKAASILLDGSLSTKKASAPFRAKIARELFGQLSEEEQEALRGRAAAEVRASKEAYDKALKEGPSKSPEARQACIDQLGRFMGPILKGMQQYTGLKGFLMLGGPIPKFSGEISVFHVSVGENLALAPLPLPAWDKVRFSRDVVGYTKEYLATAYSPQDCVEAALPRDDALAGANYTFKIEKDSDPELDSDSASSDLDSASSDSDSSSHGSNEESASEGGEKDKRGKKATKKAKGKGAAAGMKRKRGEGGRADTASGPAAEKAKGKEVDCEEEEHRQRGREYEARHRANIANNQKMIDELNIRAVSKGLIPAPKPPRPTPKPRAPRPAVDDGGSDVEMEGVDGGGGNNDEEPAPPVPGEEDNRPLAAMSLTPPAPSSQAPAAPPDKDVPQQIDDTAAQATPTETAATDSSSSSSSASPPSALGVLGPFKTNAVRHQRKSCGPAQRAPGPFSFGVPPAGANPLDVDGRRVGSETRSGGLAALLRETSRKGGGRANGGRGSSGGEMLNKSVGESGASGRKTRMRQAGMVPETRTPMWAPRASTAVKDASAAGGDGADAGAASILGASTATNTDAYTAGRVPAAL